MYVLWIEVQVRVIHFVLVNQGYLHFLDTFARLSLLLPTVKQFTDILPTRPQHLMIRITNQRAIFFPKLTLKLEWKCWRVHNSNDVGKFTRLVSKVQVEPSKFWFLTKNNYWIVWALLYWTCEPVKPHRCQFPKSEPVLYIYNLKQLDGKCYWWIILIIDIIAVSSECRKKMHYITL